MKIISFVKNYASNKRRSLPLISSLLVVATTFSPLQVQSASNGVNFSGDVTNSAFCIIFVNQGGTMTQNADGTQLSSKLSGGAPGIAQIWSFAAYDISVSAPTFFSSSPVGADNGTSFTALYSGQSVFRGRTFAEQPGNQTVKLRGGYSRTNVTINLEATNPNALPVGNYTAQTTVRCE